MRKNRSERHLCHNTFTHTTAGNSNKIYKNFQVSVLIEKYQSFKKSVVLLKHYIKLKIISYLRSIKIYRIL